jgi:hypothetical protein
MRFRLIAAAALIAVGLPTGQAGAKPNGLPYMGGADNFGEANLETMAAQIIDPNPVYAKIVPETSAEHAAHAVDRYRTDKVKKPERARTSRASMGGSGGGGGGGGSSEGGY